MPSTATISVENSRRRRTAKRANLLVHKVIAPALADILANPPENPTAFEQATIQLRDDFLAQLGPDPTIAQRALADVLTLDYIVLQSLSRYVRRLALDSGLVQRQEHKVYNVVLETDRLSGAFARKLKLFGLKRPPSSPQDVFQAHLELWRQSKRKAKPARKSAKAGGGGSRPTSDRSAPKIPTTAPATP